MTTPPPTEQEQTLIDWIESLVGEATAYKATVVQGYQEMSPEPPIPFVRVDWVEGTTVFGTPDRFHDDSDGSTCIREALEGEAIITAVGLNAPAICRYLQLMLKQSTATLKAGNVSITEAHNLGTEKQLLEDRTWDVRTTMTLDVQYENSVVLPAGVGDGKISIVAVDGTNDLAGTRFLYPSRYHEFNERHSQYRHLPHR